MGSGYRWIGMSEDREYVTIRRFRGDFIGAASQADLFESLDVKHGVVLDVETTGVSSVQDHIIEIGIRKFTYNGETGQILDRLDGYGELQDPGIPIPEVITKLTGITDAMVRGRSIDWSKVNQWISEADLVLAHNASFDRPFIEKHCAAAQNALWGCTFKQIDWNSKGFPTAKLEILSIFHGFYVDAHRALEDSDALLHLLTFPCPTSSSPYLKELLASAHCKWMRVLAKRSPFEKKDLLKGRRYRWDQNQKLWYRDIPDLELSDERTWLAQNVYNGTCLADIQEIAPTQRFRD
jgi:DNA polymerase III subunit epsilon